MTAASARGAMWVAAFVALFTIGCSDSGGQVVAAPGATGSDGTDGTSGFSPADGTDGTDGTEQTDLTDGSDGSDGADGTTVTTDVVETDTVEDVVDDVGEDEDVDGSDGSVDVEEDGGTIPDGGICVPGEAFCAEGTLYTCKSDGSDYLGKKCTNACQDDACVNEPQVCTPNKVYCDVAGKKIMECSSDGYSAAFVSLCPEGCNEATADCKSGVCTLGETRCDPNDNKKVQTCNETEDGWTDASTCDHLCELGQCIDPACSPGQTKCGSAGVEECNATMTAFEVKEECNFGCLIKDDAPMCALCLQDDLACDGYDVVLCDEFLGYQFVEYCDIPLTCTAGYCIDQLDVTGPKADNYLAIVQAFQSCISAGNTGPCGGFFTFGLEAAISVEDIRNWLCNTEGLAAQFPSQGAFEDAQDLFGCGTFDQTEVLFKKGITPNLDGIECYGYTGGGGIASDLIVVDDCEEL